MATDIDFEIDTEEVVPLRNRGRSLDEKTVKVRDMLLQSEKDGKARSFKGVTKDNREEFARRVRSAARSISEDYKVSTIFVPEQGKLYWGPETVIKALQDAQRKAAANPEPEDNGGKANGASKAQGATKKR